MKNGVLMALLSSFVFSVMNVLVKEASVTIPSAEIAFYRGLIGTILVVAIMRQQRIAFSRKGIPMLAFRGMMGGLYMLAFFYTLAKLPLTDASILAQMAPIFVIVLSALFLKEKISRKSIGLLLVVFLGAFVLLKPNAYSSYSVFAIVGLLSALFSAAASISIRYLSKKHSSYEIVFYFTVTSMLVAIPFMMNHYVSPNWREGMLLLLIGIVSLIGQLFLTKAFTHENAIVVQVVSYFGLMLNAMFGYLLWGETPDAVTVAGGLLIVAGCIGLSFSKPGRSADKTGNNAFTNTRKEEKDDKRGNVL
ncbi:DMT family transporter [Paenibacillus sp. 1011MAR3C5]|uniref:DMT family transporter n=1 Tax=Paenibacillus sp. 1011MAR3C5 TaxID=1675787 RepID=UPI000E6B79A1|nr:DMT family transporter [Paenibacillus sp. 1011MAR3C5]RJE87021.1 DMT family transporter [Paenibacillus sp. 1011MAR3C5]